MKTRRTPMAMLFSLALWLGAALLALPGGAQAGVPATRYNVGDTVNFEFRTAAQFTNTGTGALTLSASDGTAVTGSPFTMTETWDGGTSEWVYTYAWATGGEAVDSYGVQIADSDSDPTAGFSVILGNPPNQIDFFLDAAYTVPTDIFKQGQTVYVQARLAGPETAITVSNLQNWGGSSVATGSAIDQTGTVFRYNFVIDFAGAGTTRADWGTIYWQGTDTGTQLQRSIFNMDALLHNGITTESGKWNSDWGVTGTSKYGQFACDTCHERSTTNIKRIKTSIATPDGSNWDSTGASTAAVSFLSAENGTSDFGDDAAGGRTTSSAVCEACHSATDYHRYDITGQAGGTGHNNNTDCVSCHKHQRGFAAACDTCHGNPPPALVFTKTTNAGSAGAHVLHATTRNYNCSICHYNSVGQSVTHDSDGTVTMGFVDLFGPGTYTGGDYDGGATVSYDFSDAGTGVSSGGTNECSNIYCHGSTMAPNGGTDISPKWDDVTTADCGTCHGGDAANAPTQGSHAFHAGSAGKALPCADCHNGLVPASIPSGMTTHVDNAADFAFDGGKSYIGGATYSGSAAMLDAYGSCDSLYCHSNVQSGILGDGAADTFASPTWGGGALACDSCHGQAGESDGQPASGSHDKHAAGAQMNFACAACHNGFGSGTSTHADYALNVSIDAVYGGTYGQASGAPGSGYANCSNTYCHSSVQSNTGGPGASFATPTWGGGALACDSCHGQAAQSDGQPNTGSHDMHTGPGGQTDYACTACHFGSGSGTAAHVDQTLNVAIDATYGGTYAQGDHAPGAGGYGNCNNIYCHSNVQSVSGSAAADTFAGPIWGGSVTCDSCHGQDLDETDGQPDTGAHSKHAGNQGGEMNLACSTCHNGSGSGTAAHADNILNVAIDASYGGAYGQGDHAPGSFGYDSCSNVYCHSAVQADGGLAAPTYTTPGWGATIGDCKSCHNYDVASGSAMSTGTHGTHLASGFVCSDCHNGNTHVNQQIEVAGANIVGGYDSAGAPQNGYGTCSNITCHGGGNAAWGGAALTCDSCHGSGSDSDNFSNDSIAALINTGLEWTNFGHGQASTNFITKANGGDPCLWCHDGAAGHEIDDANPFRLKGNNALGNGWNDACLVCHDTDATTNYTAAEAGFTAIDRSAVVKIDKYHQMAAHTASGNNGGNSCWDCHDPHGDNSNIKMIQGRPARTTDGTYGVPTAQVATDVVFTNNLLATGAGGWAMTSGNFGQGVCNACHTNSAAAPKMLHYNSSASDSHNSGSVCSSCHKHSKDTANDGSAFSGAGGSCDGCHAYPPAAADGKDDSGGDYSGNGDGTGKGADTVHSKHVDHILKLNGYAGGVGDLSPSGDQYGDTKVTFACGLCHDMNTVTHQTGGGTRLINFNGNGSTYQFGGSAPDWNSTNAGMCSNVNCHFKPTPSWSN